MHANARRRIALLLALAALWLATAACSCSTMLSGVLGRATVTPTALPVTVADPTIVVEVPATADSQAAVTRVIQEVATATPAVATATPLAGASATANGAPTATAAVPTQAPAAPTAAPTTVQAPSVTPVGAPTADPRVTVEVSEAELNAEFAARIGTFEQDGARITSGTVGVTGSDLVLNVTIVHDPTGLAVSATVRGVPGVSNGQATFAITGVSVNEGVPQALRRAAETMMREAMGEYLGANGFPLPANDIHLESIELRPGVVVLHGRRW